MNPKRKSMLLTGLALGLLIVWYAGTQEGASAHAANAPSVLIER